jgi:hypothetical protein
VWRNARGLERRASFIGEGRGGPEEKRKKKKKKNKRKVKTTKHEKKRKELTSDRRVGVIGEARVASG